MEGHIEHSTDPAIVPCGCLTKLQFKEIPALGTASHLFCLQYLLLCVLELEMNITAAPTSCY